MPTFDVDALRAEFPALAREQDGRPVAFLDGPGGTQVPQRVIDAVVAYYRDTNANSGGAFTTSRLSDAISDEAHAAVADLLGAASPDEIKFGYNMTTLTLHIGRSIGATLGPGDEIVVTTLDHEANVSTWKAMADDRGVTVRTVDIRPDDVTLDLEDLESKLNARTKLVAVGYASNAVGTINPVAEIVARAHEVGALDIRRRGRVRAARPDRRAGPRHGLPRLLRVQVVRAAPRRPVRQGRRPRSAAGLQGPAGARPVRDRDRVVRIDRRDAGRDRLPARHRAGLRRRRRCARRGGPPASGGASWSPGWSPSSSYERELVGRLIDGLGLDPPASRSTASPTGPGPPNASRPCRSRSTGSGRPRPPRRSRPTGIYAWDGDFYATGLIERLGKAEGGGVLRLGLVHYNTAEEVDRTLEALERIAG